MWSRASTAISPIASNLTIGIRRSPGTLSAVRPSVLVTRPATELILGRDRAPPRRRYLLNPYGIPSPNPAAVLHLGVDPHVRVVVLGGGAQDAWIPREIRLG